MSVDWEMLRVLRKPQKPQVEPCAKDAGCVQAQATGVSTHKKPVAGNEERVIMCEWCKRIKEDGQWIEAEVFDCKINWQTCPKCCGARRG